MKYQVEYLNKINGRENIVAVFDNFDDADSYATQRSLYCQDNTLIVKEVKNADEN